MILKFAASDHLKILQVEVISECEGLLNVLCACTLLFYACNFCLTYNVTSIMNCHSKSKDKKFTWL